MQSDDNNNNLSDEELDSLCPSRFDEVECATEQVVLGGRPYRAVPIHKVREILTPDEYALLINDPLRNFGPKAGYVYDWSVRHFLE